MKKLCVVVLAMMFMLAACGGSVLELALQPPPVAEPVDADWESALEDFLAEFLPIFHEARFFDDDPDWGSGWFSGHHAFVGSYPNDMEQPFINAMTGERVIIDSVPYLRTMQFWERQDHLITRGFYLVDIDDDGIPELFLEWGGGGYLWGYCGKILIAALYRFNDGEFEQVYEFRNPPVFFRTNDGELISVREWWGEGMLDVIEVDFVRFGAELTLEPIISRYGDTWDMLYNHLSGERISIKELEERSLNDGGIDFSELIDIPLTEIEPMTGLHHQLMERISARLRAEGLVR